MYLLTRCFFGQTVQYSVVFADRNRVRDQFVAQLTAQRDQLEAALAERTRELDMQEALGAERVQAAIDEAENAKREAADLSEIVAIMRRDLEAETARADKAAADLEAETARADKAAADLEAESQRVAEALAGREEEASRANRAEAEVEKESLRSFHEALTQAGVEYTKKVMRVRDKFYLSGWNLAMASMGITEGHQAYKQPPPLSKPVPVARYVVVDPPPRDEVGPSADPEAVAEVPAEPRPDAAPDAAEPGAPV